MFNTLNGSTDDESGLSRCLYQLNGDEWITYADTVTLADGQYQISAKAIDIAGNKSSITTINYNVFKTALDNATNTVSVVEYNKSQEDIDTARALVNALPDSNEKTNLLNRLNAIVTPEVSVVVKSVEKAEKYPNNRNYIIDALDKANALPDLAPQKADLVTRATALKDAYNKAIDDAKYADDIEKATHYVVQSEKNSTNYNINKAQEYINLLREDDPVRIELQARLDAIKDKIALAELTKAIQSAEKAVANAEKYRTATYFNKAQNLVTDLPDIEEKQALQDRLDAIILK